MRVAITGGTGFVGRHLAARLIREGHAAIALSRRSGVDVENENALDTAFAGCDAVAHCAGINRELGIQTYARVHIEGTRAVVAAAKRAGVHRIVMLSFLRARPACRSPYHESKWAAEEIVRASGLDYTILKSGMIYGQGDHMLDHLSHALYTFPLFLGVGLREQAVRPVAVDDVVSIMRASLIERRLRNETVAVLGPDKLTLSAAARRVAKLIGRRILVMPAPLFIHRALAVAFEATMRVPLIARAQVKILSEGIDAAPFANELPDDLVPLTHFDDAAIARGLPERGAFTFRDLRCCSERDQLPAR
jgi:NADH dehydrogenase